MDTSREASLASIFNYASMAHNIHFYFDSISDKGTEHARVDEHAVADKDASQDEYAAYPYIPRGLQEGLVASFGSIENLRREMLSQANAMFGPGFVWLVREIRPPGSFTTNAYKVLATYQAGTPYPRAHWRMQGTDMNHQAGVTDRMGATIHDYFDRAATANGHKPMHGHDDETISVLDPLRRGNPGAADLTPVLCVSTWEHAWLLDWGVGNKRNFLEAWWSAVHWDKVWDRVGVLNQYVNKMDVNPRGNYGEVPASKPRSQQLPPQHSAGDGMSPQTFHQRFSDTPPPADPSFRV